MFRTLLLVAATLCLSVATATAFWDDGRLVPTGTDDLVHYQTPVLQDSEGGTVTYRGDGVCEFAAAGPYGRHGTLCVETGDVVGIDSRPHVAAVPGVPGIKNPRALARIGRAAFRAARRAGARPRAALIAAIRAVRAAKRGVPGRPAVQATGLFTNGLGTGASNESRGRQ